MCDNKRMDLFPNMQRALVYLRAVPSHGILSLALLSIWSCDYAAAETAIEASKTSLAAWQYSFSPDDEVLLEKIQRGCFQYLWKEVGHPAMLAKDKTSD